MSDADNYFVENEDNGGRGSFLLFNDQLNQ
jgi:hypothetical protein